MTPVFQTCFEKDNGNCLTACVATLLDVPIESLPEFCVDGEWFTRLNDFCRENGFSLIYWKHSENVPVLCSHAYVILLLDLEGENVLHAVVGKTVVNEKVEVGDDIYWGWKTEIVHDPNNRGYPPVRGVHGYIVIGKQ